MNRTEKWKELRESLSNKRKLTTGEMTVELTQRVKEIQKLYLNSYPEGDYLTITIWNDSFHVNNSNEDDTAYRINFWSN